MGMAVYRQNISLISTYVSMISILLLFVTLMSEGGFIIPRYFKQISVLNMAFKCQNIAL